MRLGASGTNTGDDYDFRAIVGDDVDSGIPFSPELNRLAEAMIAMDQRAVADARAAVEAAVGTAGMLDAAAVVAGFNAFPRAADATGIPLEEMKVEITADIREDLRLETFNLTGKLPGQSPHEPH